jgi:AcrR family transcriptional regulator
VAAALEFDLDALTMRALAQRLGVTHSTLYGWVAGKAELLALISTVTIEKVVPQTDPVDGDWRGWLAGVAWRLRDELRSAPGHAGRLRDFHYHRDDAHGRLHQRMIGALAGAGLTAEEARNTWMIFGISTIGWIAAEQEHTRTDAEPLPDFGLLLDTLLRGLPPGACLQTQARDSRAQTPPADTGR